MTRTSNLNRADCTGTGAITPIPINFPFAAATDLIVYQLDTSNMQTPLTLNVDYTVAGAGTTSGTVTPVAAIPSGYHWTVLREVDLTQETDIRNQGAYYPEIIEDALDKLTDITQQLSERMDRAVIAQATSTSTYTLPGGQIGYALGWVDDPTVLEPVPNTATSQAADLADKTSASRGAGMVGYGSGVAYPADTIGHALASIQAQTYRAFTAAGTAPAFTLTPTPAVASLAEPMGFEVKFAANGTTGSNTLNVSGLGAVALKQYDSTGTLVDAVIKSGQIAKVHYNGTYWVILNPLPSSGGGDYSDFKASCTGASAVITMTAARVTLRNASGSSVELSNVSETLTVSGAGAGGLDTGSLAASTWYYFYFIYNPATGDVSSLASLSATAPTLPSGYTFYRRMGAFRTDATANKYPLSMIWRGSWAHYVIASGSNVAALPVIASGSQGDATPTFVACSISNFVPYTAIRIDVVGIEGHGSGFGRIGVAPSNSYAASYQCPIMGTSSDISSTGTVNISAIMMIESSSIYYSGSTLASCACNGWEDSV